MSGCSRCGKVTVKQGNIPGPAKPRRGVGPKPSLMRRPKPGRSKR